MEEITFRGAEGGPVRQSRGEKEMQRGGHWQTREFPLEKWKKGNAVQHIKKYLWHCLIMEQCNKRVALI